MNTQTQTKKWSDYDSYLRGEHLQGKRVTLTIARSTDEEVFAGGKKNVKPCIWFKETRKGMILNDSNRRKLANLFGDDVTNAYGQAITVEPAPASNGNGLTVVIVARAQVASKAKTE